MTLAFSRQKRLDFLGSFFVMQTCFDELWPDDWEFLKPSDFAFDPTSPVFDPAIPPLPSCSPCQPWIPYQGKQELFTLARARMEKRSLASRETSLPPPVHRRVLKIPSSLMRSDEFVRCPQSQEILRKCGLVKDGVIPFGVSIVVPSFKPPPALDNKVPRNLACVYLLYTLFSGQMCDTARGKVVTFPFTVYVNAESGARRVNGYPVVAVHRSQITNAVAMMFSAAKKIVDVDTLNDSLGFAQCYYDAKDAAVIHDAAGTRVFTTKARQRSRRAYALFPASWLDSIRRPFFSPDGTMRPITRVLVDWFPEWEHRFVEEFECVFLGHRREIVTSTFVKSAKNMIKPPINCKGAKFAFGISCWLELLPAFASAHQFFTGVEHPRAAHIFGLFNPHRSVAPVYSQNDSFVRGLCADVSNKKAADEVRRKTHLLKKTHGNDFVRSFFGETKVCYRRKEGDD